jgi:hypothetical protein
LALFDVDHAYPFGAHLDEVVELYLTRATLAERAEHHSVADSA